MEAIKDCCLAGHPQDPGRRTWLKAGVGAGTAAMMATVTLVPRGAEAASLTQAQRDAMTPDQVIDMMKQGNERFRSGKPQQHDYLAQKRSSAAGQFPAAVILSCIDSRAPAEIVLDTGIGDTFNGRVAGNIANSDLLGSMEFACAAAGAKVVLVMGHTACGAVAGAIDNVELGNLTGLLKIIKPAVAATKYSGERNGKNAEFVDAVAKTNVQHTIDAIRKNSPILADLEKQGKIKIVGSMYDLSNGMVTFLS
ncbi:carbonic anhydrase [Achromobacter sp. NPDC058515]|uniref:carbonic anhydrase n=1 Tax=Achromobacter sp. NPDC058515 TaxID=3346533 RepID=UPI003654DAAF